VADTVKENEELLTKRGGSRSPEVKTNKQGSEEARAAYGKKTSSTTRQKANNENLVHVSQTAATFGSINPITGEFEHSLFSVNKGICNFFDISIYF
jgi:hypothetical protein